MGIIKIEINGQSNRSRVSPPHHEEQMEDHPNRTLPIPHTPNVHIPMLGPIPRAVPIAEKRSLKTGRDPLRLAWPNTLLHK